MIVMTTVMTTGVLSSQKSNNNTAYQLPHPLSHASDISQNVDVTGALLKKERIGGIFTNNCGSDVSNP